MMLETKSNNQNKRQTEPSVHQVKTALIELYGSPPMDFALEASIRRLKTAYGSLANVKGERILDLGCGAAEGTAETDGNPGVWQPWLPRAVVYLGGEAVGVDLGFVDQEEKFEFIRANLLRPDSLAMLPDQSFDGINCSNLFSSPHLVLRMTDKCLERRTAMADRLSAECKRLLRPDGKLIAFELKFNDF